MAMRWVALLLVLLGNMAWAAPPAPSKVVIVNQIVSGPADGAVPSVIARVGSALPSRREVTLDIDGRSIPNGATVAQIPVRDYGFTLTNAQILASARGIVRTSADGTAGALQAYMSANGIGIGYFSLSQQVRVLGSAEPQLLVWQMVVYTGQRPIFNDPVLISTSNATLQIAYTPQRLPLPLPGGVTPPNPGTLQWRTVDSNGGPLTDWTVINVGGAFDEPDPSTGRIDPDAGLKCLLNRAPSCPAATNAQDIMTQTGFSNATVDYRRNLTPVYDAVESPPGSRTYIQQARISLSLTSRTFEAAPLCTGSRYVNRGNYGLTLQDQVDRYRASITGDASRIRVFTETIVVPSSPYESSKVLGSNDTLGTLANLVINPGDASKPLMRVADIPGLVDVPPIQQLGGSFGATLVVADYHHGHCGRAIVVLASCDAVGNIELKFGTTAQVPDCARGTDFNGVPISALLRAGVPAGPRSDFVPIESSLGRVDWMFDGERLIFLPPPDGSFSFFNRGRYTQYLFRPPDGFFLKENFPNGGPMSFYYASGYSCPAGQIAGIVDDDNFTTITGVMNPSACYAAITPDRNNSGGVRVCVLDQSRRIGTCTFYAPSGIAATPILLQD